jgi:Carboxypeptidase regulatory-like domain/TonB-dependent Receptor Plug Domain
MTRLIVSLLFGLALQTLVSLAAAQSLTTGAITGTVVDQSGAMMASVLVIAKNVDTGATRETQTNGSGDFVLAQLDPGRYKVTAESNGFERTEIGPITVAVSRVATLEFKLKIGSVTATVEAKQDASMIEPSNPDNTTTFSATQLASVPNPGNDLTYVANLAPGAIMNTGSSGSTGFNNGNVEFNGLPSLSNDSTVDGLDANNSFFSKNATGASGLQLGMNAIEEVSINTASYSVDQGRLSASQINYVTKSGTNAYHGNAYEIWNGSAMNANSYFLKANGASKPRSNVNEFGASLGGPIFKEKLFFFTDMEGIRLVLPVILTSTLPTPIYQSYVLKQLPLGGTDPVLGDSLPAEPAEVPFYTKMFSLMGDTSKGNPLAILGCPLNVDGSQASGSPPAGIGCANMRTFSASPFANETLFTVKLDYHYDPNDTFWLRFQLNQGQNIRVDPVSPVFNEVAKVPSRSASAGWTHVFSPNLVNQFNPGISYLPGIVTLGDPSKALATLPLTYFFSFSPAFSTIGNNVDNTPNGVNTTTWQLNDNLSWTPGKHALRFGGDMRRLLYTVSNGSGTYPAEQGDSLARFTYGASDLTSQTFTKVLEDRLKAVNFDVYVMDTMKVDPKLTVTIGLRTTWNSNPVSSGGALSRLDGTFETISHDINGPLNRDIVSGLDTLFPNMPTLQWAPRAAVAYQPRPRTLVRIGAGIFNEPPFYASYGSFAANPPFFNTPSAGLTQPLGGAAIAPGVPSSTVDLVVAANQQFQANFAQGQLSCASSLSASGSCLPPLAFQIPDSHPKNPSVYEWSASIQQGLGSNFSLAARYVGTSLRHGGYQIDDNAFQTACSGCFVPLPFGTAPDARFGNAISFRDGANSSYNALQLTTEKRISHGLSFQLNYTYSHCLDENSNGGLSPFNQGTSVLTILPNGLHTLYGDCNYDVRHSVNGFYVYELPFHAARSWLETIVGHWQLSGTVFLRGGFPVTVYSSFTPDVLNGFGAVYANVVRGQNPYSKASIPGVTLPGTVQWLNPFAFESVIDPSTNTCVPTNDPQSCQVGNSGRNTFRAPGFRWTDLNIAKQFRINEHVGFRFETQFYNLLNHPNFGYPGGGFPFAGIPSEPGTLTGFGTINSTVAPITGLVGGQLGGDSSVRMIALRGTVTF